MFFFQFINYDVWQYHWWLCGKCDVVHTRPNTPPGSKLKLVGKVVICNGYLLLYKANCKLLGGRVQSMVDSWNLKRVSAEAFHLHLV